MNRLRLIPAAAIALLLFCASPSVALAGADDTFPGIPLPDSPASGDILGSWYGSDYRDIYYVWLERGDVLDMRVPAWRSLSGGSVMTYSGISVYLWGPGDWDGVVASGRQFRYRAAKSGYHYLEVWDYPAPDLLAWYDIEYTHLMGIPIEGQSRFDTAVAASQLAFYTGADTVVVTTGRKYPDALGGAALAGVVDGPILLVEKDSVPAAVREEIAALGATRAIVLGGPSVVSQQVVDVLKRTGSITSVSRIGGTDRYSTARMVAREAQRRLGTTYDGVAFVATGKSFADALAAAPIAYYLGWPIYLAGPSAAPWDLASQMAADGVTDAIILGGSLAVSDAYEDALRLSIPGSVSRVSGTDRYDTAVQVAEFGVYGLGLKWNQLAIATGGNFPDALAGSVVPGRVGSVMLLTRSSGLPPSVESCLASAKGEVSMVEYLGGRGAVSQAVRDRVSLLLW